MRTWTSLSLSPLNKSATGIPVGSTTTLAISSPAASSSPAPSFEVFPANQVKSQTKVEKPPHNPHTQSRRQLLWGISQPFLTSPVPPPKLSPTLPSLSSSPPAPSPQSSSARRWRRLRLFVETVVRLEGLWGILGWILVRGRGRKRFHLRCRWFSLEEMYRAE